MQVFPDKAALSQAAAEMFVACAETAVSRHNQFIVALSGGSTPKQLFKLLAQPPFVDQVPWQKTHVFWGDERLVPPDDAGSNYFQATRVLLDHVPIPPEQIHRVKGELDVETAVSDYTTQLKQLAADYLEWPRFDLVLLGMGSDGHTASLFPGQIPVEEVSQPVMGVTAVYENRPAQRVTLTPLVFNNAHHVLFLLAGAKKAEALTAVLDGPHNPEKYPAQRIRPYDGELSWFVSLSD